VFVYGIEHYAASFHSAHCLGVPVRVDGEIVGCLDVSVTRAEDADPTHMALAQACVASVETSPRAIHNLITNAMTAMPEGGTLRLRTAKDAGTFVIEIEDTGQGIPPELGNSVFEPFVTGRSDGTGLGLYMVHQAITKEHKGRVWFDSKPGRGTTFVVELPVLGVSGTLTPLGSAVEAAN
jgi:signal transduction histidine kinase